MPRGSRLSAAQKAREAVDKAEARQQKLAERRDRQTAALHQTEKELHEIELDISYLKQHPALQRESVREVPEFDPRFADATGEKMSIPMSEPELPESEPAEPFPAADALAEGGVVPIDTVALKRVQEIVGGVEAKGQLLSMGYVQQVVEAQNSIRRAELEEEKAEPKLTPNQVDPRDEPTGEKLPPITYDPPKREPAQDPDCFVSADPFAD
jgi:hypothetical protein